MATKSRPGHGLISQKHSLVGLEQLTESERNSSVSSIIPPLSEIPRGHLPPLLTTGQ